MDRMAASTLHHLMPEMRYAQMARRIIGDWELIGTTSPDLVSRQGLTGLGVAPFTSPVKLFYSFRPTGEIRVM